MGGRLNLLRRAPKPRFGLQRGPLVTPWPGGAARGGGGGSSPRHGGEVPRFDLPWALLEHGERLT